MTYCSRIQIIRSQPLADILTACEEVAVEADVTADVASGPELVSFYAVGDQTKLEALRGLAEALSAKGINKFHEVALGEVVEGE